MSDFCFVVAPVNLHWVLDRIAKEIGSRLKGTVEYCYDLKAIPKANHYFVTHYSLLPQVILVAPSSKITCFFTHESVPVKSLAAVMNLCHSIVCESPRQMELLESNGINPDLLNVVVEAGDNQLFKPHARTGKGAILLSGACYPRKNPGLVLDIMKKMPNRQFVLIGKDWKESVFPGNVDYYNSIPYEDYPNLYGQCDVFLSCSTLEGGGPGGLIEAMHSNLVPVVSDTGNAREYIVSSYNGFIFPVDSKAEDVIPLIEKAYTLQPQESLPYNDIWQTVSHNNWDEYASNIEYIMKGVKSLENSLL